MEKSETSSDSSCGSLKEDGHFFDFVPFYMQPQFCDRTIRLEILDDELSGPGGARSSKPALEKDAAEEQVEDISEAKGTVVDDIPKGNPLGAENETVTGKKRAREEGENPGSQDISESASGRVTRASERLAKRRTGGVSADVREGSLGQLVSDNENGEKSSHGEQNAEAGQGSSDGDEAAGDSCAEIEEAEEIPISLVIVAAKSHVLRAMLTSEMREGQKDAPIVLKVTSQEKRLFKEMIGFFYTGTLSERLRSSETPASELIAALLLGDKFDAPSFMGAVLTVVKKWVEKNVDSDLDAFAVDVPEVLQQRKGVKAVVESAREALLERFKNVANWGLPRFYSLSERAVEFLLQAEGLEGSGEEEIVNMVYSWVQEKFQWQESNEEQEVLLRLARHIRFGCLRGEVLGQLLDEPEMQLPELQKLILRGLVFQASSDPEKLASECDFVRVRKGFREATIDIILNVIIDEKGLKSTSRPVTWNGRMWCLKVEKSTRQDPATVGVYLTRCASGKSAEESDQVDEVEVQFFARRWPSGYWALLKKLTFTFSKGAREGWGSWDMFGKPWHTLGGSSFAGCTKEITLRVVARRLIEDSSDSDD